MRVVVPVRSFQGMARLAGEVPKEGRARLSTIMAERLVRSAADAALPVTVVTGDDEVIAWARDRELEVVLDPAAGLNAAAAAAIRTMEAWAIVHADLPLVTPEDLQAIRDAGNSGSGIVLSPSHNGGTSVVAGATPTFPFRYGPGSFRRHLAAVRESVRVVVRRGLAVDVDQPRDLVAVRRLGALP